MDYRPIRNSGQLCPHAVRFQSCLPSPDLADCVQEFWQYDVLPGFPVVPIQVFPSGCVVLRFDIGPGGVGSVIYPPSASPQMKSVFRLGVSSFGVALRVGRAYSLLDCSIDDLGAKRRALVDVWTHPLHALEERLLQADGFRARTAVLSDVLRGATRRREREVQDFGQRLDAVLANAGVTPDSHAGLTDRTLRRRFDRYVGHSPKQLQRVVRVQSAMRRLACDPRPLPDLALASGFSDQPHLNREFVRLIGMTPGFFRRSLGRFHEAQLPIWSELPFLRELRGVPRSERGDAGAARR